VKGRDGILAWPMWFFFYQNENEDGSHKKRWKMVRVSEKGVSFLQFK